MSMLPRALENLIEALAVLPGVGSRSAERYAQYLLRADRAKSGKLADSLENLHDQIKRCPKTFALIDSDQDVSSLYADPRRDKQVVAVVEDSFDIIALERIGAFSGTYHVLGGLVSPIDGVGPEMLTIDSLAERVTEDNVKEVILATNASVEGESTALYIQNRLQKSNTKVTRLARGLPIGLDLEYADQITLGRALEGRQIF